MYVNHFANIKLEFLPCCAISISDELLNLDPLRDLELTSGYYIQ